jgi:hypothetical protein
VTGKQPIVTIRNRRFTAETRLKVAIITAPDGTTREWNSTYEDVKINTYAADGATTPNRARSTMSAECRQRSIGTQADGSQSGFGEANGGGGKSLLQWKRIKR